MVKPTTRKARKLGRPSGSAANEDRRKELINIAGKLFGDRGYDGVSLKEICNEAEVTPAMISYYFDDKAGLMRAVMQHAIKLLLTLSESIYEQSKTLGFAEAFSRQHLDFMSQHHWILHIFTREVLTKDADSRRIFMEDYGEKTLALLSPRIREDQENGVLRSDLNPDYTQLSLIGMCIFPLLAAPVLSPLFGYKPDADFAKNYGDHVLSLFMDGAGISDQLMSKLPR